MDRHRILAFDWIESETDFDRTFTSLLVEGTLDEIDSIDALIESQLEHWDLGRLNRVDLAILRVGTYGLRYQRDIPAQVTIDEAVEIAKELSTTEAYRFVNGVLDGVRKRVAEGEEA